MSTASSSPRTPRMSYESAAILAREKEAEAEAIKPFVEQAQAEKTELEKADGDLDIVRKEVEKYVKAIQEADAQTGADRDEELITRLRSEKAAADLAFRAVQEAIEGAQKKIDELNVRLAKVMQEAEEPNRVVSAELRMNGEVPPSISEADEAYEACIKTRDSAIESVSDHVAMKALEATEAHIQPMLKELDAFLQKFDKAAGRLKLPEYPVLDAAKIAAVVEAFGILPGNADPKADAEKAKSILEGYNKALEEVAAKKGSTVTIKLVDALQAAVARLKELDGMVGPENQPDRLKARREDFQVAAADIRKNHQGRVMVAEEKLYTSMSEPGDRDFLVSARLGEAVPVAAPVAPEHPVVEGLLKERSAREDYLKKILGKLGIPFDVPTLVAALDVRKQDATNNNNANISDKDLMEQLMKDIVYLLDPSEIKDTGGNPDTKELGKRRKRVDRLKALGLSMEALKPEELELILHSVDGGLDPKAAMSELKPKINLFITKLKSVNEVDDLNAEITARWTEAFDRFNELLDGSLAKRDKDAKVPKQYRHKDPEHYKKLVLAIEGVAAPVAPGAPGAGAAAAAAAAEKAKIEGGVDRFITSMQRAEAVQKETKTLQEALAKRGAAVTPALEAVRISEAVEKEVAEIEQVTRDRDAYLERRGVATDPDTKATERKAFPVQWKTGHDERVRVADVAEKAAKKAVGVAVKALDAEEKGTDYLEKKAEIAHIDKVLEALRGGATNVLENPDDATKKLLETVQGIDLDGKMYTGASLVAEVKEAAQLRSPFGEVTTWVPPMVKQKTYGELMAGVNGPPEVEITFAYDQAEANARPAREAANWVVENWMGKEMTKTFLGFSRKVREKNAVWKQELMDHAEIIRDGLQAALPNLVAERREIARKLHESKDAHLGHEERAKLQEDLHRLDDPLEQRQKKLRTIIHGLTDAVQRPAAAQPEAILTYLYDGLFELTLEATGVEPNVLRNKPTIENFTALKGFIGDVKHDPAVEQELLQVVHQEELRLRRYENRIFPQVAFALETSTAVKLDDKRRALQAKEAQIQVLDGAVKAKEREYVAADQALQATKVEKLEDGLAEFDRETAERIDISIDPSHLLGPYEEKVRAEKKTADEQLDKAQKGVRKFMKGCAETYKAWLDKKAALMAPTATPAELEKQALGEAKQADEALFEIFKKHGAPDKGVAADFKAWYDGLTKEKGEEIANALVPNLFKTP